MNEQNPLANVPFFYFGSWLILLGGGLYLAAVLLDCAHWLTGLPAALRWGQAILWWSRGPVILGLTLITIDLALMLPWKRGTKRRIEAPWPPIIRHQER